MKNLIEVIVKAIVDVPEAVEALEFDEDNGIVIELTVAKSDIGKVIGKEGRTIQAIRHLLSAHAGKIKRRVTLEVIE
jgi:predicted RNA-binding protein YlqC (UPF0109 family)